MTYKQLIEKYPPQSFGYVSIKRSFDKVRMDPSDEEVEDKGWYASLGHQFYSWEIGGIEDTKKMIENMSEAVVYMEQNS